MQLSFAWPYLTFLVGDVAGCLCKRPGLGSKMLAPEITLSAFFNRTRRAASLATNN